MNFIESKIASFIDYTLLKPETTSEQIIKLCEEAIEYKFAAVCVNPFYVSLVSKILRDSSVQVASVVGFPLGANLTEVKVLEARNAVENGADEIDMVMNIGAFKNGDNKKVIEEIEAVIEASNLAEIKVIVETAVLNQNEKEIICKLLKESRVTYIKTSTGFIPGGGAVPEDIQLFKKILEDKIKIKASGGIQDLFYTRKLLNCGAERIGTSSGINIVLEEIEDRCRNK